VHAIDVGIAGQPGLKAPCRGLHTHQDCPKGQN
jgi:hypothetical protein